MVRKYFLLIFLFSAIFFILFQSQSIFGGDGGDLVSAICVGGIPHPPGYPLYMLLGRFFYSLPLFTPAWRVSLLSSLPAAGTITVIYLIIWQLTKSKLASIIGAATMAFSYLFWLYASVPEVFSLNNLFIIILLYLTILIMKNIDNRKVFLFFFIAGLSASHHHFSFWFYPVFIFFIYKYNFKYWQKKRLEKIIKCFALFFLGLIPYFYILLAARTYPVISWNNAVNLENFWKLITRQGYGTFLSHPVSLQMGLIPRGILILDGLLLIPRFFGWPWIIFIITGLIYLYRHERKFFLLIFLLLLAEELFLFYLGFPINNTELFILGMYSRFVLPELIFSGILLGVGIFWFIKRVADFSKIKFIRFLVTLSLFVIPVSLFIRNVPKIMALRSDFTAENLGRDILATVSPGDILLLSGDTEIFDTEYVYFCLKEYPKVRLIPMTLGIESIRKKYPDLVLPQKVEKNLLTKIIELNASSSAIFSNTVDFFKTGVLVPTGMLVRFYAHEDDKPPIEQIIAVNEKTWARYHSPLAGILKWFRPTTLSEVINIYQIGASRTGLYLLSEDKVSQAKSFFLQALKYNPQDIDSRLYLSFIYTKEGNCLRAEQELFKIINDDQSAAEPYFYLAENARECYKNKQKEIKFNQIYGEKKAASERNLKELEK
ncbi:MAG: DUF2723 domain-containing protein [Candidatus Gottesmanbacteria bacterium]